MQWKRNISSKVNYHLLLVNPNIFFHAWKNFSHVFVLQCNSPMGIEMMERWRESCGWGGAVWGRG
jgi:hypothetical protein